MRRIEATISVDSCHYRARRVVGQLGLVTVDTVQYGTWARLYNLMWYPRVDFHGHHMAPEMGIRPDVLYAIEAALLSAAEDVPQHERAMADLEYMIERGG